MFNPLTATIGGTEVKPNMPPVKSVTIGSIRFFLLFATLLRSLTPDELDRLRRSIELHGILQPIVVDEDGNVIDGGHRLQIAAELGLDYVPTEVVDNLTTVEKRHLALSLNTDRRHLSRKHVRELIENELRTNPGRSNRMVAADLPTSSKTVASVREDLESGGEIPHQEKREDRRGRRQSANKNKGSPGTTSGAMHDSADVVKAPKWWRKVARINARVERFGATINGLLNQTVTQANVTRVRLQIARLAVLANELNQLLLRM